MRVLINVAGSPELLELRVGQHRFRPLKDWNYQQVVNFTIALDDVAVIPHPQILDRRKQDEVRYGTE